VVHHFLGPLIGKGPPKYDKPLLIWPLALVRWLTAVMGPVRNLDSRVE
jgi:hypothetical protein